MGECTRGYVLWARAVEQGGMGHTAAAFTVLDAVVRLGAAVDDAPLVSLALSTRASLLRQAGRHTDAAAFDGRALALLGCARPGRTPVERAAILDGLVGLAADHLGQLRLGSSARLLTRARALVVVDEDDWLGGRRPALRIEWVSAELAIYSGDPAGAAAHAQAGTRLALVDGTPERHRVKTALIAAAAVAAGGEGRRAAELATEVTERAQGAGLLPLSWASLALRVGLDPGDRRLAENLARTRAELVRRGVPFPWVPVGDRSVAGGG